MLRSLRASTLPGHDTASDDDPVLNFPHNFAPLHFSRLACGWFNPSAWLENGQGFPTTTHPGLVLHTCSEPVHEAQPPLAW